MSKERDLLVSCLDEFQYHEVPCKELIRTIQCLLNEPEQTEQEPLSEDAIRAIVNQLPTQVDLDTGIEFCRIIEKAHGIKREPLSEDQVSELLMSGFSTHLMDLVRMVEKAHGIGGGE